MLRKVDVVVTSVQDLIEQMESGGDWPSPDILSAIIDNGDEAIEPLRDIVRRGCVDPEGTEFVDVAAGLLGDLKARAAVPDLLQLFRTGDEDTLEWTLNALAAIGSVPIEPVEAIIRDKALVSIRRGYAIHVYEEITRRDADARVSLGALLCELLQDLTNRARTLSEGERELAGTVVSALADLALPDARPTIDAAFAASAVDHDFVTPEDVERAYREGGKLERQPQPSYVDFYRTRYEEEFEREQRQAARRAEQLTRAARPAEIIGHANVLPEHEAGISGGPQRNFVATPVPPVSRPKVGRNEPCPCGSGKKFKKCCGR